MRAAVAESAQSEFDVISNPEFLREGVAIEDFMKPERVVIGIGEGSPDPHRAETVMRELYRPFLMSGNPLLVMDARSAEVTKYAANSDAGATHFVYERHRQSVRKMRRRR